MLGERDRSHGLTDLRGTQRSSGWIVLMNVAAEDVDEIQTGGPRIPHGAFAELRLRVEHQLGVEDRRDHVVPLKHRTSAAILVILYGAGRFG